MPWSLQILLCHDYDHLIIVFNLTYHIIVQRFEQLVDTVLYKYLLLLLLSSSHNPDQHTAVAKTLPCSQTPSCYHAVMCAITSQYCCYHTVIRNKFLQGKDLPSTTASLSHNSLSAVTCHNDRKTTEKLKTSHEKAKYQPYIETGNDL